MSYDDPYIKMVETSLKFVGELGDQSDQLAQALYGLMEGDGPEEAAALLQKYGYTNEDGFWIDE